jgi:hypothetical protein
MQTITEVDKTEAKKVEIKEKKELIKSMTDKYNELGGQCHFINLMMDKESKTGRNNMCHCGSGKKYKNCCLFLYDEKVVRTVELRNSMRDIALEIKGVHKEIKELESK